MNHSALDHERQALVEVHVARQELAMPPTITLEQAAGFGLFMRCRQQRLVRTGRASFCGSASESS